MAESFSAGYDKAKTSDVLYDVSASYRKDIEIKLKNDFHNVSSSEATDWWLSYDPVSEILYRDLRESIADPNNEEIVLKVSSHLAERPNLCLRAGVSLLRDIDSRIGSGAFVGTNSQTVDDLLDRLSNIELPVNSNLLDQALIASHIFSETAERLAINYTAVDKQLNDNDSKIINFSTKTALLLLDKVRETCKKASDAGDFSLYTQALSAAMDYSSIRLSYYSSSVDAIKDYPYLFTAVQEILDTVERFYILNPDTKASKAERKGPLHEALWMLDMNFYLATSEDLRGTYVAPSLYRMDRPNVGDKNIYRSYDMVFFSAEDPMTKLRNENYIQLKSSNRHKKIYHPSIHVLTEDNFREVQRITLDTKLNCYRRWLANPNDNQLKAAILQKALPTVEQYLEHIKLQMNTTTQNNYLKKMGSFVAGIA